MGKSKSGKIVSKAASIRAKKAYASSGIKAWADACKAARKALNLTGFVPIGGKSSLYGERVDCCNSVGNDLLQGAGAVAGIGSFALALLYPVDVYPSRCKRNHYQVCTMTEPNAV